MSVKTLSQKVEEYISTLDKVTYVKETPRGWIACGIKNNRFIVKEIKDHLC